MDGGEWRAGTAGAAGVRSGWGTGTGWGNEDRVRGKQWAAQGGCRGVWRCPDRRSLALPFPGSVLHPYSQEDTGAYSASASPPVHFSWPVPAGTTSATDDVATAQGPRKWGPDLCALCGTKCGRGGSDTRCTHTLAHTCSCNADAGARSLRTPATSTRSHACASRSTAVGRVQDSP